MTVRLATVIDVLNEAYPPALAASWDSVGLVCGDPEEVVSSVTIAIDATAEVVDEVPDGGLLLAHHPLLLRGVDTVAASTAKGALVHRLIRSGRSLFTAHTNADSASPGVSDALAQALGLTVEAVLEPSPTVHEVDKWVIFVPPENAETVRTAVFTAGASPAIGSLGAAVNTVAEERLEVVAPARARRQVLSAMREAHPHEEPAFEIVALTPPPADVGLGRIGSLPQPESLRAFVSRVKAGLPQTSWGVRAAGNPEMPVSRVAVCGGAGDSLLGAAAAADVQAYVTADLRHHPADEHRRASEVALIDVAHWASEYPWCEQAAAVLRSAFGAALSVHVCPIRTDPWNVDNDSGGDHR
jgi:dinuclear metal center YbgI/SA1388 family protein